MEELPHREETVVSERLLAGGAQLWGESGVGVGGTRGGTHWLRLGG